MNHAELCAAIDENPQVLRHVMKYAKDDLGVAWQACYAAARSWRPGGVRLFSWLYTWAPRLAQNILYGRPQHVRRRNSEEFSIQLLGEHDWLAVDESEPPPLGFDEIRALRAAVARLKPNRRRVIEGRYFHSKSWVQIGRELGVTSQRVHQIAECALQDLRKVMAT